MKNFTKVLILSLLLAGTGIAMYSVASYYGSAMHEEVLRVEHNRIPSTNASHKLILGVNKSLSGLRGYMLLEKQIFKDERATGWSYIDDSYSKLKELSSQWSNKDEVKTLMELSKTIEEFRKYQQEIEDITTYEPERAKSLLGTKAAPRARIILGVMNKIAHHHEELLKQDTKLIEKDEVAMGQIELGILVVTLFLTVLIITISMKIKKGIEGIVDEISNLSVGIIKGKLDTRASVDSVMSDFQPLAISANKLIEEFVKPINLTSDYINNISSGKIPPLIEEDYQGDFKDTKDNLNSLINTLNTFINDMNHMIGDHEMGDIQTRIDSSQFQGTYVIMADGVNKMANDHIQVYQKTITVLEEFANGNFNVTLERFPGQKAQINNAVDLLKENLQNVNSQVDVLYRSYENGDLSYRGDSDNFKGDWAQLIDNINKVVSAILAPIDETVSVLEKMANGDLKVKVTSNYKGDHALLKNSINQTIDQMPFNEALNVLNRIAEGDLTARMIRDYKGDALELKEAINTTMGSISDVINQVSTMATEVKNAADQVSDSSAALSQGATEQAASLEEITSSMQDIGSKTRENASSAKEANELSLTSKDSAHRGNTEMENLNVAMEQITTSSQDISKIMKVIDEIAFQTNLLALNAAVEAARAGRHGKGFAVVAEEVRNLAGRSASAAKETADLIESSINAVKNGASLASTTKEVLVEIQDGAEQVTEKVSQITELSSEQATGIAQINEGLEQIDKVTQQNTASAEQSAAAAEELSGQANNLKVILSKFKIDTSNSDLNFNNHNYNNHSYDNSSSTSSGSKYLPELTKEEIELEINLSDEPLGNGTADYEDDDFGKY